MQRASWALRKWPYQESCSNRVHGVNCRKSLVIGNLRQIEVSQVAELTEIAVFREVQFFGDRQGWARAGSRIYAWLAGRPLYSQPIIGTTKPRISLGAMQITVHLCLLVGFGEPAPGGCTQKDRCSPK
jgi:hypothetical protein